MSDGSEAPLAGKLNPIPLSLFDQAPLKFRKAPMTDSMREAIGESSPVKVN